MKAVPFDESNAVMTADGCNDLPVLRRVQEVEGLGQVPVHISVWELDATDMINILATQRIQLTIVSAGQPPVVLQVMA